MCATAKAGWKVTRFVAPVVGRFGAKVTGRVAKAAATGALNVATQLASQATRLLEPTPLTPAEIAQRDVEIAQQKRRERVMAFWVFVTLIPVFGGVYWMVTLPKAELDQMAGFAGQVIFLFVALLVGVGVVLVFSTKTGRLFLGLIRFCFGIHSRW